MAIAFRSVGTVKKVTTGNPTSIGLPLGHAANDVLVLWMVSADNAIGSNTNGYTLEQRWQNGTHCQVELWWKYDSGSESAPSVTRTGTKVAAMAWIAAYSGCPTGLADVFRDAQAATGTGTTTGNFTINGSALTGVVAGDFGIDMPMFTATDTNGTPSFTIPTGFSQELGAQNNVNGADGVCGAMYGLLSPDGTAFSSTAAWNGSTTPNWIGVEVALSSGGSADTSVAWSTTGTSTPGFTLSQTDAVTVAATGSSTPVFTLGQTDILTFAASGSSVPVFSFQQTKNIPFAVVGKATPVVTLSQTDKISFSTFGSAVPVFLSKQTDGIPFEVICASAPVFKLAANVLVPFVVTGHSAPQVSFTELGKVLFSASGTSNPEFTVGGGTQLAKFLLYRHTGLARLNNIEQWLSDNTTFVRAEDSAYTGLSRLRNVEQYLLDNPINETQFTPYNEAGTDEYWAIEEYLLKVTNSGG